MHSPCLLVSTLVHPERVPTYTLEQWDLLVRQARSAQLLARLRVLLEDRAMLGSVPDRPRRHLERAWIVAERQREAVHLEVAALHRALGGVGVPTLLLKGAAYAIADLPTARGRTLSDIDILVPKRMLPDVESALMLAGWATMNPDEYDQRYYRRWMHEIPPMQHIKRGTVLDVHHAILPETARIRADSQAMRESAVPASLGVGAFVFAPADMVLHSATHLFHEGEVDKALRDLVDIDSLLRQFATNRVDFWHELLDRARATGLGRHLFYALRYAALVLATPVPSDILRASETEAPPLPTRRVMDALYLRAFRPNHASCADRYASLARGLLYVRGHWLRMPTALLVWHLAHKALARERSSEAAP